MNIALLDPFEINIPSSKRTILTTEKDIAICCTFNRRGTHLAAGTSEGKMLIWDLMTYQVAMRLHGHVHIITSLSFSRCGRYLLSTSLDWNAILWDLSTGTRKETFKFEAPILMGKIRKDVILLFPQGDLPLLIYTDNGLSRKLKIKFPEGRMLASCIEFSHDGQFIYIGTNKGLILIYNRDGNFLFEYKVCASLIKQIHVGRSGRDMIVNSNDRIIRSFRIDSVNQKVEQLLKYIDSVEKKQWLDCAFSADGEYVVGACGRGNKHEITIWDKTTGVLVKLLNGPLEGMSDMTWHPIKPMIASVTSYTGVVYLWQHLPSQKFSAFDPTFTDIEDNIEYVEREDEFDKGVPDSILHKKFNTMAEDEDVDIEKVDKLAVISDTDDEDSDHVPFTLPVGPYHILDI